MIIFIYIGLSAAIGDRNNSYPDQEIKVVFAFGLAIATIAQCIGHISGTHLDPAITLGLLASCEMSMFRAFFYIIAQILGAVVGSAIVYGIRPDTTHSLGLNKLNGISPCQGFGVEFLLTLQLVLFVLAVTDKRRDVSGFSLLAIGLSVGLGHLARGYWAGPTRAGGVEAILYNYVLAPKDEPCHEKTRVLFCCVSTQNEICEPFLEDVGE